MTVAGAIAETGLLTLIELMGTGTAGGKGQLWSSDMVGLITVLGQQEWGYFDLQGFLQSLTDHNAPKKKNKE